MPVGNIPPRVDIIEPIKFVMLRPVHGKHSGN